MNKATISILSLLAREPLSGYDIKQQMNDRISHFSKVSNNQIYPQISKLEEQQLIALVKTLPSSQHIDKKIYQITAEGLAKLKESILKIANDSNSSFLTVVYNSWLLTPAEFKSIVETERKQHVDQLSIFENKLLTFKKKLRNDQLMFSSWSMLEYGRNRERMEIAWCDQLLTNKIEQ